MSKLKALNDWVLVQKYDKARKKDPDSPFTTALAVSNTNLGVVLHVDSGSPIKKGQRVYYVGSVEKMMLEDATEVLAIKSENIVAVVSES